MSRVPCVLSSEWRVIGQPGVILTASLPLTVESGHVFRVGILKMVEFRFKIGKIP